MTGRQQAVRQKTVTLFVDRRKRAGCAFIERKWGRAYRYVAKYSRAALARVVADFVERGFDVSVLVVG